MSIVVSETSPRALLDSVLQLSSTLNLLSDGDTPGAAHTASARGPGFILHEVEKVLLQIRKDLDIEYAPDQDSPDKDTPLMMRLRQHIDATSSVLTGNSVQFSSPTTTTLHELIDSLSVLNSSVSCRRENLGCSIS